MSTLIVYSTKYDFTKKCVEELSSKLQDNDICIINIADAEDKNIDIDRYDTIIVGSSVYMGMINNKIKEFCTYYKNQLLNKNLGLFIVCSFTGDVAMNQMKNNFDEELLSHSIVSDYLGGDINIDKVNFWHKLIIKVVSKADDGKTKNSGILYDRLDRFVENIC